MFLLLKIKLFSKFESVNWVEIGSFFFLAWNMKQVNVAINTKTGGSLSVYIKQKIGTTKTSEPRKPEKGGALTSKTFFCISMLMA